MRKFCASRNQAERPVSVAPVPKRRRDGSDATREPARDTSLLSLPINFLHMLLDELSSKPGTVGSGSWNTDAYSLARTCRRLYDYYLSTFAIILDMTFRRDPPFHGLLRALQRLPRVHSIVIDGSKWHRRGKLGPLDGFEWESDAMQGRALHIKSLKLISLYNANASTSCGDKQSSGCVRSMVETFGSVEHLTLRDGRCVEDDSAAAIAKYLPKSLQTLDLMGASVSDAGAALFGKLRHLKSLSLARCRLLTDEAFYALHALEELEELDLSHTRISDAGVHLALENLHQLRMLSLESCPVTDIILPSLPRSLVSLNLTSTDALNSSTPGSAFQFMSSLKTLVGCNCSKVTDLSFLAPGARSLQVLRLSRVGASDANVSHWITQMPNMVELDLSNSAVSDETANAISSLRKITSARLKKTRITNDGVRALTAGVACRSLEYLNLCRCPGISDEHAVSLLKDKVSSKGYGRVHV